MELAGNNSTATANGIGGQQQHKVPAGLLGRILPFPPATV